MKNLNIILTILLGLSLTNCTVIRQGEIGMKQKLGKLEQKIILPGAVGYNPFFTRIIKLPIRTMNMEINSNIPSKEGLNVQAVISILYRMTPDMGPYIVENIGSGNEVNVISSVFRSAAADVCSRFFAKDMHSVQRASIELEITKQMSKTLAPRGFEIEAVLLKNISLPQGLARAVEEKLEAEQTAQQMMFLLDREKLEAERKIIEAEGIRDAQKIISEGLSDKIIEWQTIEAFQQLGKSPNTKIIITDGKTPMLLNSDGR